MCLTNKNHGSMKASYLMFPSILMLFIFAAAAYGQTAGTPNVELMSDSVSEENNVMRGDRLAIGATILLDSLTGSMEKGWYKQSGEMPILIPGILPNSMAIIVPPAVDQKMIIPLKTTASDKITTGNQIEGKD